ncbi:unnamed protein product [Urochloa humidicola]
MRMEGFIPFVFGAIKKRRATRRTMHFDLISTPGASPPPQTRPAAERRLTGDAYYHSESQRQRQSQSQSQSCRFVVRRTLADELQLLRDGSDDGHDPTAAASDGRVVSRSRRFSSMRALGCVSDDVQESAALSRRH